MLDPRNEETSENMSVRPARVSRAAPRRTWTTFAWSSRRNGAHGRASSHRVWHLLPARGRRGLFRAAPDRLSSPGRVRTPTAGRRARRVAGMAVAIAGKRAGAGVRVVSARPDAGAEWPRAKRAFIPPPGRFGGRDRREAPGRGLREAAGPRGWLLREGCAPGGPGHR